jgi:hypothetical protein
VPNRFKTRWKKGAPWDHRPSPHGGAKLKAFIKKDRYTVKPVRRGTNEGDETSRIINKLKPTSKSDMTDAGHTAYYHKVKLVKAYQEKRAKFLLSGTEKAFACNLSTGKSSSTYYSTVWCKTHACEVSVQNIKECENFIVGDRSPQDCMWAINDLHQDLYDMDESVV